MTRRPPQQICWRSSFFWPLALFLVSLSAPLARAEPVSPAIDCREIPDCVVMVQSAHRLSEADQLHAARETYEAAYARWQSPWLLINIGRIQQKLGHPAEAIVSYQHYLDSAANDKPERIEAARDFLKQAEQDLVARRNAVTEVRATEKPLYKKWWFWSAIGVVAVVAAGAITVGVVFGNQGAANSNGTPGPVHIQF